MAEQEKLLPHDVEAEEALLGSLLIDPDAILRVVTFLKSTDFYDEAHASIFEACANLYQRGESINQITVAHELHRLERLERIGGAGYLSHVIATVPTSIHAEEYGHIVERMSVMRRLINAGSRIAAIGYESGPDIDESLSRAEDALFNVRMRESNRDFVSVRDVLDGYLDQVGKTPDEGEDSIKHGWSQENL